MTQCLLNFFHTKSHSICNFKLLNSQTRLRLYFLLLFFKLDYLLNLYLYQHSGFGTREEFISQIDITTLHEGGNCLDIF